MFDAVMSVHITLWKVKIPLDVSNKKFSALMKKPLPAHVEIELGGERLRALQRITNVFQAETLDEVVEVLVERPVSAIKDENANPPLAMNVSIPSPIATKLKMTLRDRSSIGKRPEKRLRALSPLKEEEPDDDSQGFPTQDTSRLSSSQSLARQLQQKGLEFYYNAGRTATATPAWSISKVEDTKRVEQMFFEFQKARKLPQEWPANGLAIDDCTAFMQMIADSGQGVIGSKITKRYFLKTVRIFRDLVCIFYFIFIFIITLS